MRGIKQNRSSSMEFHPFDPGPLGQCSHPGLRCPLLRPSLSLWRLRGVISLSTRCGVVFTSGGSLVVTYHVLTAPTGPFQPATARNALWPGNLSAPTQDQGSQPRPETGRGRNFLRGLLNISGRGPLAQAPRLTPY